MKKYTTKPIDFTGCHPVIAEHLKRGEAIECRVWDNTDLSGYRKRWVYAYCNEERYPYRTIEEAYRYAEPVARKIKRVMPPERAIPVLIAEGWKFGRNGDLVGYATNVLNIMFKLMGRPLSDPEVSEWEWPDCIIEEVDE